MERIAIIDIGTNSVKLLVADVPDEGPLVTIVDTSVISRLGEGFAIGGALGEAPIARNAEVVRGFASQARDLGATSVEALGTMCLRSATNSADFVTRVEALTGVEVRIIPGEEEARLSYLAVLSGLDLGSEPVVVFDTGGGSTEFIFGEGEHIEHRFSLDIGSVRLTEQYLGDDPPGLEAVGRMTREIDATLRGAGLAPGEGLLVGMGGTVTSMSAVAQGMTEYDRAKIQGAPLTRLEVEDQIARYATMPLAERRAIPGLRPKRAEVILAGASIVRGAMIAMEKERLVVSDRGIRHGLAFDQRRSTTSRPSSRG